MNKLHWYVVYPLGLTKNHPEPDYTQLQETLRKETGDPNAYVGPCHRKGTFEYIYHTQEK